jgi:hypothetical protein
VSLEEALAELYAAPLDDFVATRTRLAKELRGEGNAEAAAELARLRKPTLALWIVNRLAHERSKAVAALLRAGDELRAAQTGSTDLTDFKQAQNELAKALDALGDGARDVAREVDRPVSDSATQRVRAILRAAAVSEESRPLLERGVLGEVPEPTGFDAFVGLAPRKRTRKRERPRADEQREQRRRERLEELRGELSETKRAERAAAAALRDAERELDRVRRRVAVLEEQLEKLEA